MPLRSFYLSVALFCFLTLMRLWFLSEGTMVLAFFSLKVAGAKVRTFFSNLPWSAKFSFIST